MDYKTIVTWDDYKKAGIQVYEKTGKYMGTADTSATWQTSQLLAQQGTDFTDDAGNPVVNSEAMVKALTLLKDLQDNNVIATIAGGQPDTEEAYGEFNAGNYATAFMPLWQMSRYTNYMKDLSGKIAIAPIPVIEKGMPRSVGGGGTGTVVTKTAKDVQLAKDFLAFAKLSEDANIEIWNTLGFDPVNMDVWEMKDVTHNPDNQFVQYFVNNPFDVLADIKDEIRLIKSTSASPTINNVLCTVTLNEIFEDGKDIKQALDDAQAQIEQELK
ncbi:putative arabinose-binding protein precursor [compost metagenome]